MGVLCAGLLALSFTNGCVGRLGAQGEVPDPGGTSPPTGGPMGMPACNVTTPTVSFMRRLSNVEYTNTIHDLIGGLPANFTADMPSDEIVHGYDNNSENASFSDGRASFYRDEALAAAGYAFDPSRRAAFVGCDPTTGGATGATACLRTFAQSIATRAFRRPVASDEVDALVTLGMVAADDPDPYMPEELVTQAVLRTSDFLYRVELGTGAMGPHGGVKLSGSELATRLSFMVFNTAPSAALLATAAAGHLDTADGLETQLQTMLADPAAQPDMRRFFSSWLQLDQLGSQMRTTAMYPAWTPTLAASMREETLRTTDELAWGTDGNMLDLLTGRFSWVNDDLAAVYGLPTTGGTSFRRVTFPDSSSRIGLLTQASTLTANSADHEVLTIIRRGKWVRDVIMCDPLPPPPANIPPLAPPTPGQSVRQELAQHRANPACAGCHDKMDPIGEGLSLFDEIGATRTMDSRGQPIDTTGQFNELAPAGTFDGAAQMSTELRSMPSVASCMATQVFRYTFGRSETADDACTLSQLATAFSSSNNNFRQLLVAFVRSDAFRYRGAPPDPTMTTGGGP